MTLQIKLSRQDHFYTYIVEGITSLAQGSIYMKIFLSKMVGKQEEHACTCNISAPILTDNDKDRHSITIRGHIGVYRAGTISKHYHYSRITAKLIGR